MQVSVILPVLNEVKYIPATLDAILKQKNFDNNIEILIVDGSSTDGTIKIVENYITQYPFVILLHNPEKFVSTGFNLALNQAKGEYIIRIDGHCEIPPNYIEECINMFEKKDADIVGGRIETISEGIIGESIAIAQSSLFGVGDVKFRQTDLKEGGYVNSLAFGVHKRKIFHDIGGYDEEMIRNQDDEFNFRAIQVGKKIWMTPAIKTKYYSRTSYSKLFMQYFNYGCFKVRVIQKRRQIVSIRHLIPSIFIIGLIGTLISGYYFYQSWLSFSVLIIYFIVNIISSIIASPKIYFIPLVFLSYLALHLSYGLGFIWGLLRFASKWSDNKLIDDHFNRQQFIANNSASI